MMVETSVIIPTYNRSLFFKETIKSVLSQSYIDFEIIIVDDSVDDAIKKIVEEMHDPRLKYIHNDERMGVSHARNEGIRQSTGLIVAFIDDDDVWRVDYLQKQVKKMIEKGSILTYSNYCIIDEVRKEKFQSNLFFEGDVFQNLLKRNFISTSGVVVRKDILKTSGLFDESLPTNEDWDLWLRISREGSFSVNPEILVEIRRHGDQLSTKKDRMVYGKDVVVNRYSKYMTQDDLHRHIQWLAINQYLYGDHKKGLNYEDELISAAPWNIKYRMTKICFRLGRPFLMLILKITGRYYDFL